MTHDDATLTRSSGNVFADLGFAEPEASVHKMRSELMIAIEKMIDDKHLSQTEAA
jgi:predicted XRE-type DNA-binding protein